MKPRTLTFVAVFVGASATVLITVLPFVRFAYRSPAGHLVLDTAAAFIALLTAFLVLGRFARFGLSSDFLMACSLLLFGFTNLFLSALGDVIAGSHRGSSFSWAIVGARLIGVTSFTCSALIPERHLGRRREKIVAALIAAGVTVVALAITETALGSRLGPVVPPDWSPEGFGHPRIVGHPVVLGLQLIMMAMFAVSSIVFTRRAEGSDEELWKWLGAAAALGAFSRLNYFLFPSVYSQYLYTGDFLRFGFYALVLVGATREILRYWSSQAEIAVLDERRRLARDIHDGLGQELAFIRLESERSGVDAGAALKKIASAAERALEESRLAVAALTSPRDEPTHVAIARAANDVARRAGVAMTFRLEEAVVLPPELQSSLLRVVREAVGNAIHHGHADEVTIRLRESDRITLAVEDNGIGFDPSNVGDSMGFGISSMRERVALWGGTVEIDSAPGNGTVVRVVLPRVNGAKSSFEGKREGFSTK